MRKVFDVELGAGNDRCTELTLPATPWSMQDALEKLKLKKDEVPRWEILRTHGYDSLYFYLDRDGSLFELNALCQRLSQLDERQTAVVKGLAKAEFDQGVRPVPMGRIIDMAYSTDRCHFLSGIMTDAQLGRSCAENDLVPEVADLSDSLFEMLNFEKIGREFRQAEGGVLTKDGYVQRHDELRQISKTMNFTPIKPDYAILVRMASSCEVKLPLPLGEIVGDEPVLCIDCAAPGLIGSSGGMEQMDQLAHRLTYLTADGELPKYKALLTAVGCNAVGWALDLAGELDEYDFFPDVLEPDEAAGAKLERLLPADVSKMLMPYVCLYPFGQELIQAKGGRLTGYGLIERTDGSPIHAVDQEPAKGGMELMQ